MTRRARGRAALFALLAGAALSLPRPGLAQSVGAHPYRSKDQGFVELSAVFTASPRSDEVSATSFAPQLSAGLRFAGSFSATVDAAFAYTSLHVAGEAPQHAVRPSNPIFGIHYAPMESRLGFVRIGFGTGPPLVLVSETTPANTAAARGYMVAAEARGFQGYWLWARNTVPLVLFLSAQARLLGFVVGAELQPAALISLKDAPSRAALLANASLGYRIGPITPGLRGQVLLSSQPLAEHDFEQISAAAFLRLDVSILFARAEATLNLDGPYGVFGAKGSTVWGTSAGAGVRF